MLRLSPTEFGQQFEMPSVRSIALHIQELTLQKDRRAEIQGYR